MISEARHHLDLDGIGLRASVSERIEVRAGDSTEARIPQEAEEFPLMRGKIQTGMLWGSLNDGESLDAEQFVGMRAVAGFCSLVLEGARARELAAVRAAHGSMVQLASEALRKILEEDRLYKSVLVLTLELMDASGGAVLLEDGEGVTAGDIGEDPAEYRGITLSKKKPWIGSLGGRHAVGIPVGRESGALFLVRESRPHTTEEGASLKLVARQLDRARERAELSAAREKATLDTIAALAATLETRDGITGEHIRRTQGLAERIVEALDLTSNSVRVVRYASVLHDIGKVGIPDAILNKPGKLDENEWEFMRRHPRIGADIVDQIEGFEEISAAIIAHHERYDGGGYPFGLKGEEIPIEARIISVVDTYDAMTSDRPYRRALSHDTAIAELSRCAGTQFDTRVVEAFCSMGLRDLKEREDDCDSVHRRWSEGWNWRTRLRCARGSSGCP
ncbi:MAG: HD-GYP domain-containing protein [Rubrobacteraceae bacterium]